MKRGGKGVTSNRYVVLNCPTLMGNRLCYGKTIKQCADCTDCVIKQVIEKCNIYKNFTAITINDYAKRELALHILDLFDIEEINK